MAYECKTTFSSMNGTLYRKGETITLSQLSGLPADERAYFRRVESYSAREDESSSIIDTAIGLGLGMGLSSLMGSDDSSGGSGGLSSDFDGFGGGDFGGGGASDDF